MEESALLQKIGRLEEENRRLKELLTEAGIDFDSRITSDYSDSDNNDQYDPDQGSRIHPIVVTDKVANQFFMLFCRGRQDVYDLRYTNPKNFSASDVQGKVSLFISDRLYVDASNISNRMKRAVRQMTAFSNRQYFQNLAMDLPNYDTPRYIYLGSDEGKYIVLPRGLEEKLEMQLEKAAISYTVEDKRSSGRKINVTFKGQQRETQEEAVSTMLKHDTGILHAATAFGKTVVCCKMIAEHKVNTLILVDKADLMNQ